MKKNNKNSIEEFDFSLEELIKLMPGHVYWKDRKGRILGCNQAQIESWGFKTYEEIIGKTDYEICKNEDAMLIMSIDTEIMSTGIAKTIEEFFTAKDGHTAIFISKKVPLKNKKNDVVGMLGISFDITRTKEKEIMMEDIISAMPGHVYWKDTNCILLGCNDLQAKDAWLKSRKEVVGKTAYDLIWKDQPEAEKRKQAALTDEIDKNIMKSGLSTTTEEEVITPQGLVTYWSSKVPLKNSLGEVIGLTGISIDITERKKMEEELKQAKEQAEDMNKLKTEFLSNMSHDVKTPLAGVISLAESLTNYTQEPKTLEAAEEIIQCGQSLFSFFDNCLELSQLDNADVTMVSEFFNLEDLIDKITSLFKPAAKAKKLILQAEYDSRIPKQLLGSRPTIFRIVQNLIGNAIKFTDQGVVSVKVTLGEKSTSREAIVAIIIQDTGVGISKDKQKIIFERLTRLTPSYEGIYAGSGIGLYLVQKFVNALSGQIYVESEETKGSQFTVVLPLQIPLLSEKEYKQAVAPSPLKVISKRIKRALPKHIQKQAYSFNTSGSSLKILLVEDNQIARKTAKVMIEDMHHVVDVAQNSTEAMKLFAPNKYDLVFTDIGLPDLDGYKLTERLRQMESDANANPTPIVALTAHDAMGISNKANASGISNILSKPLSEDKVIETIAQFIHSKVSQTPVSINEIPHIEEKNNRFTKKAIDLNEGARILGKDRTHAERMLREFMRSLPESRTEIEKAYRSNNVNEFSDVIHQFYGGLCYVGAPYLRQAAKELENTLVKKEKHQVNRFYQRLLDEMSAVEKEFEKDFL